MHASTTISRTAGVESSAAAAAAAGRALRALGALALVAALAATGCSKKGAGADEDRFGSGIGSSEFETGTGVGAAGDGYGEPEKVRELASIYFDYDSSAIRADARATLQANAGAIQNRSEWRQIIIEGHTDERGSEEYNLALGERRANATRQYLEDLGVPSSRLRVVSFGESAPAVQGSDESAWRWNRRVEFRVVR
jgi:peptidoglycan-associated lipoprotein